MFTAETTAVTLSEACRVAALDPTGARLLRLGSNAVYRLERPIVARIARAGHIDELRRTVAVARWLESVGYPAVRALNIDQPVVVDGAAVTFWEALSDDGDAYASVTEVAELLVRLHSLAPPATLHLPAFDPFSRIRQRLEANAWLSDDDRAFLIERLADAQDSYSRLCFPLPEGVIHGDANVGNVLRDQDGKPVVIDLDGFAIGPREWDLIQTAIFYDEFGWHTRDEYESFVALYGFDIMQWNGYAVLRDIRELHMVTWLIQNASDNSIIADEGRKRINSLRTGASRRDWQPY